jgi:L-ascorbate metabolism protein UlaG (beta-lactamase superfamily)
MRLVRLLVGLVCGLMGTPAIAAGCFPIAETDALPRLIPASWRSAALPEGASLQLTFLGHSSFLIETAEGATAVTDYNGYMRPAVTPMIVTMNNAHGTHYTTSPEAGIQHVLRGWNPDGGWAAHDVSVRDLRIRNIPTAVHGRYGGDELSNSIFVFETPELCIAHLGHLHHVLTEEQVAELGQIDILLVPIDGAYTMSHPEMVQVIEQIRPAVVVPMHYFGPTVLGSFVELMAEDWQVDMREEPTVTWSRSDLPYRRIVVLPGV